MKFVIKRHFAIGQKRFEILDDGKSISMVKVKASRDHPDRFNLTFDRTHIAYRQNGICRVLIDATHPGTYSIVFENPRTNARTLFAQLTCRSSKSNEENFYSILLGEKLYQVSSSVLRNRRLTIVDTTAETSPSYPRNLLQVNDFFSQSNRILHLTIEDEERAFGYLSLVLLLQLHESKRMSSFA